MYAQLLDTLAAEGVEWVQVDEPILVTELDADWQHALNTAYHHLKSCKVKASAGQLLWPAAGQQIPGRQPARGRAARGCHPRCGTTCSSSCGLLPAHKVLSLGVINGRNIWKTDLERHAGLA